MDWINTLTQQGLRSDWILNGITAAGCLVYMCFIMWPAVSVHSVSEWQLSRTQDDIWMCLYYFTIDRANYQDFNPQLQLNLLLSSTLKQSQPSNSQCYKNVHTCQICYYIPKKCPLSFKCPLSKNVLILKNVSIFQIMFHFPEMSSLFKNVLSSLKYLHFPKMSSLS